MTAKLCPLLLLTLVVVVSRPAQAQMPSVDTSARAAPSHLLGLNADLMSLTRKRVQLGFERVVGGNATVVFNPSFALWHESYRFDVELESGARVYVGGAAPSGLFLGPLVAVGLESPRAQAGANLTFKPGLAFGYNWVLREGLTLSAAVGASYYLTLAQSSALFERDGLRPLARLGAGWAF